MSLSVGIVGLPNAGKSTLFNALASRRLAETAPRPFTTIEPHEAVVSIHDEIFHRLVDLVKPEKAVPATVTFIDIAGLVKDAHKGEGLGNQFLAKIREVDAIVHVVRAFKDENVSHVRYTHDVGSIQQIMDDVKLVNLELELGGISNKPILYVLNVDEEGLQSTDNRLQKELKAVVGSQSAIVRICAKLEEDMIELDNVEKGEIFKLLSWDRSALEQLIQESYKLLGLITFYTIKGGRQAHAWSIKKGSSALSAAEIVHTDFAKKFIKAEVVGAQELILLGSWKKAKESGKIRLEGRDYIVQNNDVIEFKVGT